MTKMVVKKTPSVEKRKLVAVIGSDGMGLSVRYMENQSVHINNKGEFQAFHSETLEEILERDEARVPVYEGDSITLEFSS